MALTEQRLLKELPEFEKELSARKATLDRVKDLLGKADRRFKETENKRRWHLVLDNLEHALDEAKARVLHCELEIERRKRKLEELAARREHPVAPGAEPDKAAPAYEPLALTEEQVIALQAAGVSVRDLSAADLSELELPSISQKGSERVLAIPLEELSQMTLDEVEQLHSQILTPIEEDMPQPAETSPAPETSPQSPIEAPPRRPVASLRPRRQSRHDQASFYEQHKQRTLRNAVQKIRENRIDALTIEEIDLVNNTYERLSQQVSAATTDEELKNALGAAMEKLGDKCAELRRKRAQMYARRHR